MSVIANPCHSGTNTTIEHGCLLVYLPVFTVYNNYQIGMHLPMYRQVAIYQQDFSREKFCYCGSLGWETAASELRLG